MTTYEITIVMTDVAEGDATGLAQQIHDEHGEAFDAPLGDFTVRVAKVNAGAAFDTGWEPQS